MTPKQASNNSEWHVRAFDEEYRRMGHWRLTFPIGLARSLGYGWVLQMDADSVFEEVIEYNMIQELDHRKALIAGRATYVDLPTWGLPELTRYFLVAEQIVPTILFDFCKPPGIDGLYTVSSETFPGELNGDPALALHEAGGWNKTVIYGNFILINTAFWYQHDVQKYLNLVLGTGGHFRFRWNEQSVIAMIWQVFVPYERFHLFQFTYSHQDHHYAWGVTD